MDFSLVDGWNLIQTSLGPPHDGDLGTAMPRTFPEPVPVRERFAAPGIVSIAQQHPETHVVISCRVSGPGRRRTLQAFSRQPVLKIHDTRQWRRPP
jgi:hypothetical protein